MRRALLQPHVDCLHVHGIRAHYLGGRQPHGWVFAWVAVHLRRVAPVIGGAGGE